MDRAALKVFTNIEMSANIFQYLDFKEQLNLTKVNGQFKIIIKKFIWKSTWKNLHIFKLQNTNYINIRNIIVDGCYVPYPSYDTTLYDPKYLPDNRMQSVLLTKDEFAEFLRINNNNVQKIEIVQRTTTKEESHFLDSILREEFLQLTSLKLINFNINANNLLNIAAKCPKLKSLICQRCLIRDFLSTRMNMLTDLTIVETSLPSASFTLMDILNNFPMLHVFTLVPSRHMDLNISANMSFLNNTTKSYPLQELNTELTYLSLSDISKTVLNNCQNIQDLSITRSFSTEEMTDQFFDILIASCKLKILTLNRCLITWRNLKQILNEMQLKSFTSIANSFSGDFETFKISPTLLSVHLETKENDFQDELKNLLEYNKENVFNLKTLVWHNRVSEANRLIIKLPSECKYKNLQTLTINVSAILYDDIFKMDCLKKLSLIGYADVMELSRLLSLLKHPTLKHLTLPQIQNGHNSIDNLLNDDALICETKLHNLNISLKFFIEFKNVFLKLLSRNFKLKLYCYYYNDMVNCEFLNQLINDDNFPKRIKSIKLSGFQIDCKHFKDNIEYAKDVIFATHQYVEMGSEAMPLIL